MNIYEIEYIIVNEVPSDHRFARKTAENLQTALFNFCSSSSVNMAVIDIISVKVVLYGE